MSSVASGSEEAAPSPRSRQRARARAIRFANVVIGLALLAALSQLFFGLQLGRPMLLPILAALLAMLLAVARTQQFDRRLVAALVALPSMLLTYTFEWRITRGWPYDGTAAARRGAPYDPRSPWEVIQDRRAEGKDAVQSLQPRGLLVLDPKNPRATNEAQLHVISPEWGVVVGGERVLPLGGLSNRHVVHCNESGRYSEYESDEHGFNNPRGIWDREQLEVALLGDSFTHGACVSEDATVGHAIRARYPATVNLGMAGNGPLLELAGLEEYAAPKRPRIVLWVYYSNDMADLEVEKRAPLLMRYLDESGFSQRLFDRQVAIDAALRELAGRVESALPSWPGSLAAVGLTRQTAPMWLGDLVMKENQSSVSSVLRLDHLTSALASLAVVDFGHQPPDLPLFKRVLGRARSRVESWGGRLYFVYMADVRFLRYGGQREHDHRAGVLAAAREVGIPVIDSQPAFMAHSEPDALLVHRASHCNARGYALLAEVILKALEESGEPREAPAPPPPALPGNR